MATSDAPTVTDTASSTTDSTSQISSLRPITRYITTTTPSGTSTFHASPTQPWDALAPSVAFNTVYSTTTPIPDLTSNADLHTYETIAPSLKPSTLVIPTGTICRLVDMAPNTSADTGVAPPMHKTASLDYGVVVEGEVELWLEDGEMRVMKRGDVVVQRGTSHAWRNKGPGWSRVMFVMIGVEGVEGGVGSTPAEDLKRSEEMKGGIEGKK